MKYVRTIFVVFVTMCMMLCISSVGAVAASEERSVPMFVRAPLIGFDRNTLQSRDMRGRPIELEDTGLEYGLFGLVYTKHFTFNNFLSFCRCE